MAQGTTSEDDRIGQLLVEAGAVSSAALASALAPSAGNAAPDRLGDRLVRRGDCAPAALTAALERQALLRTRLGRILVAAGLIDEDALARGLDAATAGGIPLGEALVALGHATRHTIDWALAVQAAVRRSVPVVVLTLTFAAGIPAHAALAGDGALGPVSQATLAISVEKPETRIISVIQEGAALSVAATAGGVGITLPAGGLRTLRLEGPHDGTTFLAHSPAGTVPVHVSLEAAGGISRPLRPGDAVSLTPDLTLHFRAGVPQGASPPFFQGVYTLMVSPG